MANLLKMARIETIFSLHQRGWSQRQIARELGIDRGTVARYLRTVPAGSKPANAPTGSEAVEAELKPANAPSGSEPVQGDTFWQCLNQPLSSCPDGVGPASGGPGGACEPKSWGDGTAGLGLSPPGPPDAFRTLGDGLSSDQGPSEDARQSAEPTRTAPAGSGRRSQCAPWQSIIVAKLEQELTAQRIYQDLLNDHGFQGSYYSVRRFISCLERNRPLPVRRLSCAPGEEAQVDFGTGAWLSTAEGKRRRTHVFRIVLSHSRKGYSEATLRQTTDDFLRCLEDAFWYFGGVPRRLLLDNLKAGVLKADWFDPDLNPKFDSFCQHYGIVPWPLRPRKPEHKGKVERGVGYVQDNALKARTFASLEEENQYLLNWETTIADRRIHGTTRRQVGSHFLEVERPALQPLPAARFRCFHEGQRTVNRDGHLEVARAFYSVPPEFLGRRLWARWDGRLVEIFDEQMRRICAHVQREPGHFSTQRQHLANEKISAIERGAAYYLLQIRRLGFQATRWAEAVLANRGIEGVRVLQGLRHLAGRYRCEEVNEACAIAFAHGCFRLRALRQLLDRRTSQQQTLPFLDEHPLIRPLRDYDNFIHNALQLPKEASS